MTVEQVEQLEDTEKFTFQTEISRLMSLIINSLYKTREIFLRELISNASDALDKIRFMALTDSTALASNDKLSISIAADPESKTITITDTGIGMTREQLKQNLGTIAKSGTSEFLAKVESSKDDVNQIGQFGVGFYSVFLVADKVTVASKSNDDDQYIWSSQAVDDFVIAKDPRGNTLGRGTQITLHLKEDAEEFLNESSLRELVSKYSEFINFPIYLWSSHEEEVPKEQAEDDDDEIVEENLEEEGEESKKGEEEIETRTVQDWERINTQKPIWMRNAKEIEDDEYVEFYRAIAKEPSATPLSWTHVKGEGDTEFRSILYVSPKADPNFFQNLADKARNVRLFVKRVFITDEFELFPKWLSFLKGIVDADDLPLNVSRETLQQHRALRTISKHLVKKALDMFHQLAKDDDEKFGQFFKEYGSALKFGAIESNTHRKKIAGLLRFPSSYDPTAPGVGLDGYISRMKGSQKSIFYLAGMSVDEIEQSPFLERLLARGYEVLYLTDPIDEMLIQNMPGYNGKMFANVAKGDLKFGDEEEMVDEQLEEEYEPLQTWLKTTLADEIDKVVLSKRLTTSPMAIVAADFGLTGHMERLMAAQGQSNKDRDMMLNFMKMQKKTLEINPKHPIIKSLAGRSIEDMDEDTKQLVQVLYETTAIRSGYPLQDLNAFTKRVETIIRKGVGASLDEQVEVDVEAAPEKSEEEKQADEVFLKASQEDHDEEEDVYLHDEL
ncbi:Hsp90 protein-domain-containing protein [Zychaea mexicana]|uniref:Hsp90 protein-domain-containing protein n=1 Tax=Zychaea mexicana TaxID=64656 RepID=UPI0022FDB762|nr:Hsp90 protein-domain-containing protein [Zychaea mexicana]KAI9498158.1 Hsp90 protein-domain-containing protein [Zychaea mexicana]